MANHAPNRARLANLAGQADDEFYTPADDVACEMQAIAPYLKGKRVFLPCDDFTKSHFAKYLAENFHALGLRGLCASCYYKTDLFSTHKGGFWAEFDGVQWTTPHYHSGDFRTKSVTALALQSDVIITNPPFSLFRAFYDWLKKTGKDFHVLGNINAMNYFNVFDDVKDYKIQCSENCFDFTRPDGTTKAVTVCWFSTFIMPERVPPFRTFTAHYDPAKYPVYENLDNCIEVARLADIPCDYAGLMGLPITVLNATNRAQVEIVGMFHGKYGKMAGAKQMPTAKQWQALYGVPKMHNGFFDPYYVLNGLPIVPYNRILCRLKNPPPNAVKIPTKINK